MKRLRAKIVIALMMIPIVLAPIAIAEPDKPKPMIECQNHTHVWKREDCREEPPFGFGGGGSPPGGLLGTIGRVLHGLTGGLL